ncbi:CHAD domain-containing protein [Arthrobacter pascens]|uniref:CHAD domain-containing protein n=1 Tax=Arthrobacter pascens TaxID=1677 RepID=UPI00196A2946|nr:CHAD domain-containing protein [Arthrobacter pascens]MBN3496044.1 CHAD domain-containing protein [Arthrobacter pascens]
MTDAQKPDEAPRAVPAAREIDAIAALLAEQLAELLAQDPGVRAGSPAAARKMRSAARRSRSLLEDHRKLFKKAAVKSLRAELKWVVNAVGPLRHATMVDGPVHGPNHDLPMLNALGLSFGPAENTQRAGYDAAYGKALAALESDRYFGLISGLQAFCAAPRARSVAKPA